MWKGLAVGVAFIAIGWLVGGGMQATVASGAVDQYEIAKRGGDKVDRCVRAGIVAAAYLQAKDEANYATWKQTEKADCKAAGVRR